MEWIRVRTIDVMHKHRPAKVVPKWVEGMDLNDYHRLPPVLEASALPAVELQLQIADEGTGYGGYLIAHCQQCDLMFYNSDWWEEGRDNPRVAKGLQKRYAGADVPQKEEGLVTGH